MMRESAWRERVVQPYHRPALRRTLIMRRSERRSIAMIGLALLAVVLVIGLVIVVPRARQHGQTMQPTGIDQLAAQLRRWADKGLLTEEQAAAILAAEHPRTPRPAVPTGRVSVMVELLGYLGAVLAIIGAVLLAARYWQDLATWTRLTLLGLVAAALWAAGTMVREHADPALWRLRAVLWLLSSAAVAFFAALLAADVLELSGEAVALVAGLATATQAGLLWWRRPRPLQQLACLAGVVAATGGGVAVLGGSETVVGLSIWAVGVGWVLLGWRGLLPPAVVALLAGGMVLVLGAQAMTAVWEAAGLLLGLASAVALLVAGTRGRRLVVAGVGIWGVVMFLPATVVHFFAGTVGVPVLILLAGVVLLTITLVLLGVRLPWPQRAAPTPPEKRPAERTNRSDSAAGPHAA
jgi:hypothetical protein